MTTFSIRLGGGVLVLASVLGCGSTSESQAPRVTAAPPPAEGPQGTPVPVREAPPVDNADAARATELLDKGAQLYRQGSYDPAEQALKEAVTLYPFLAEAHLLLGKILLIRASATRDRGLMDSARLMFEMARALDPKAREPVLLLELFGSKVE